MDIKSKSVILLLLYKASAFKAVKEWFEGPGKKCFCPEGLELNVTSGFTFPDESCLVTISIYDPYRDGENSIYKVDNGKTRFEEIKERLSKSSDFPAAFQYELLYADATQRTLCSSS